MRGWISLHRKILENPILSTSRVYSRFEAFVYLLLKANHKDAEVPIGSTLYKVKKGELITSQMKLCKKFKWGNTKLRNFLNLLQNAGMVGIKTESKLTWISISNYVSYQDSQTDSKLKTKRKQTDGKLIANTNNNDNNDNNENKLIERKNNFIGMVLAEGLKHTPMIEPDILEDFNDYWTEPNKSKTRMKFELQKTFDIGLRLKRWLRNDFNGNKNSSKIHKKNFKLTTTGNHYVAYCECGNSDFYDIWKADRGLLDTKCCGKELLDERK